MARSTKSVDSGSPDGLVVMGTVRNRHRRVFEREGGLTSQLRTYEFQTREGSVIEVQDWTDGHPFEVGTIAECPVYVRLFHTKNGTRYCLNRAGDDPSQKGEPF